jgi:class 3 adenylate cyclase
VHSTAGDGAVVAFPSCTEGFAAAKRIQTDIEDFNRETNRLGSPFRLRVGLHVGRVAGELEKVQFTEVIDIAAHVQTVAPVGGIAMTELVAEQLGGEPAVQLKDPVDGHTVMLVLNPTVDQ